MNRAQRRRHGKHLHDIAVHCADCNSETRITQHSPGVYTATIYHDTTCPWYRAQEQQGNQ